MFGWEFDVDAWSRFSRWNLIKICCWTWDMNSTLGSVVPLAMFKDKRRKSQASKDQWSQVLRWSQYSKASWGRSHWSLVSMTRQHGEETWLEVAVQGKVLAHRPLPLGCFTSWVIFMVKMIERALCFLVPDNPGSSTLTLCMTCRLQLFLIQTYLLALADGWPVALHLSSTSNHHSAASW